MNTIQGLSGNNNGLINAEVAERKKSENFGEIFNKKINEIKFSAHAQTRIKSRNIDISSQDLLKLKNAVTTAQLKGSVNSLILLSNKAFIVNIPNRTVVTAMDGENIRDNIFTNIDSTVIAG
jgi:flagellar operon protein